MTQVKNSNFIRVYSTTYELFILSTYPQIDNARPALQFLGAGRHVT